MSSLLRRICVAAAVTLITGSSLIPVPPTSAAALTATTSGQPASHTIAGGYGHTCLVNADTTVSCWGEHDRGQLGDGTDVQSSTPLDVLGLTDLVSIDGGYRRLLSRVTLQWAQPCGCTEFVVSQQRRMVLAGMNIGSAIASIFIVDLFDKNSETGGHPLRPNKQRPGTRSRSRQRGSNSFAEHPERW